MYKNCQITKPIHMINCRQKKLLYRCTKTSRYTVHIQKINCVYKQPFNELEMPDNCTNTILIVDINNCINIPELPYNSTHKYDQLWTKTTV